MGRYRVQAFPKPKRWAHSCFMYTAIPPPAPSDHRTELQLLHSSVLHVRNLGRKVSQSQASRSNPLALIRPYRWHEALMIHPVSPVRHAWDLLIMLLAMFTVVATPFRLAFYDFAPLDLAHEDGGKLSPYEAWETFVVRSETTKSMHTSNNPLLCEGFQGLRTALTIAHSALYAKDLTHVEPVTLELSRLPQDCAFIGDVLLSLNCGLIKHAEQIIVMRRKSALLEYLKTNFFIDALSAVPWDAALPLRGDRLKAIPRFFRMFRMLRLLRLTELLYQVGTYGLLLSQCEDSEHRNNQSNPLGPLGPKGPTTLDRKSWI